MSRTFSSRYARRDDSEFVIAAATAFYADWAMSEDDKGNSPLSRMGRRPNQCDVLDVLPDAPRWALRLARGLVDSITKAAGKPFDDVLTEWLEAWEANTSADREATESNAGWYAAMQAMGHGVGLWLFIEETRELIPSIESYPR